MKFSVLETMPAKSSRSDDPTDVLVSPGDDLMDIIDWNIVKKPVSIFDVKGTVFGGPRCPEMVQQLTNGPTTYQVYVVHTKGQKKYYMGISLLFPKGQIVMAGHEDFLYHQIQPWKNPCRPEVEKALKHCLRVLAVINATQHPARSKDIFLRLYRYEDKYKRHGQELVLHYTDVGCSIAKFLEMWKHGTTGSQVIQITRNPSVLFQITNSRLRTMLIGPDYIPKNGAHWSVMIPADLPDENIPNAFAKAMHVWAYCVGRKPVNDLIKIFKEEETNVEIVAFHHPVSAFSMQTPENKQESRKSPETRKVYVLTSDVPTFTKITVPSSVIVELYVSYMSQNLTPWDVYGFAAEKTHDVLKLDGDSSVNLAEMFKLFNEREKLYQKHLEKLEHIYETAAKLDARMLDSRMRSECAETVFELPPEGRRNKAREDLRRKLFQKQQPKVMREPEAEENHFKELKEEIEAQERAHEEWLKTVASIGGLFNDKQELPKVERALAEVVRDLVDDDQELAEVEQELQEVEHTLATLKRIRANQEPVMVDQTATEIQPDIDEVSGWTLKTVSGIPRFRDDATQIQPTPTCDFCRGTFIKLWKCRVCKTARYCSMQCQAGDWLDHKMICKRG